MKSESLHFPLRSEFRLASAPGAHDLPEADKYTRGAQASDTILPKHVIFFIDGFNLYHALANKRFYRYKWLDLSGLAEKFITKKDRIEDIYYFTALATWSAEKVRRHKLYNWKMSH